MVVMVACMDYKVFILGFYKSLFHILSIDQNLNSHGKYGELED